MRSFQPFARLVVIFVAACGGPSLGDESPRGGGRDEAPADSGAATGEEGAQGRIFLFAESEAPPPLVLELDKPKALALFGEDAARRIRILDVDTTSLLTSALERIRDACGTRWRADAKDPQYDCSLTPLGQSFGPSWRTSAAFALVRLLGMTPANANLEGSPLAAFAALVEKNPTTFRFDFADVLAEGLGKTRTSPLVATEILVRALQKNLLGTHPAVRDPSGALPVSLYDALVDFASLPEVLGPVGKPPFLGPNEHPGVLVPDAPGSGFSTRSDALGPNFRMRVVARSNLVRVRGVDLSAGGGDMFVKDTRSPLSFDFEDPAALVVSGVAQKPTIDMRFSVFDAPSRVHGCDRDPACRPFMLPGIVTEAARQSYGQRVYSRCFLRLNQDCLVGMNIGGGAAPARISFENALQGVPVPPPMPIWDLLAEVADVAIHDPTGDGAPDIPVGLAKPVFALRGVPIGPSGEELVRAMRPRLQAQADEIGEIVAGRYWENNDALDLYLREGGPSGAIYLYFVDPSDEKPDPARPGERLPYRYARPGFFSSPDLGEPSRVSSRVLSGIADQKHEKLPLSAGEAVVYAQDDEGDTYELRLYLPENGERALAVEVVGLDGRRSP